jgi:DNA-binding HxlR family transcriptional regulator
MDEKLREPLREQLVNCGLPAALEVMGERWSFMILRAAFNGLHHFEEFQSELGIARNILANRLGRLVEHGILTRDAMIKDRRKIHYQLTEKGAALLPAMLALRQWGERWETGFRASPVLVDARDRRPIKRDLLWALPEDVDDSADQAVGDAPEGDGLASAMRAAE